MASVALRVTDGQAGFQAGAIFRPRSRHSWPMPFSRNMLGFCAGAGSTQRSCPDFVQPRIVSRLRATRILYSLGGPSTTLALSSANEGVALLANALKYRTTGSRYPPHKSYEYVGEQLGRGTCGFRHLLM